MTFLHSGLLLALALTAVPVILHLLLKQKPKRIDFPALRLVQSRTKKSTKRLRLRHLLLLLLRIFVIGAMVFAAARPLLPAADWSFRWWDGLVLMAVVGGAIAAWRWLSQRVAREPGQATRDSLRRRGEVGIIGASVLTCLLAILLPYGWRVARSMKEAPSAEALDLPVAGVFVFDVSASMSYREAGKTLLDVGRQIVADHVGALPTGSKVAILNNADDQPVLFQLSLSSVPTQLERLATAADSRTLNQSVRLAYDTHARDLEQVLSEGDSRDRFVRRVYVVTDLAKSAWQFPDSAELEATLSSENAPNLFVLDVGADSPTNRGFAGVSLSSQDLPRGGLLTVNSQFRSTNDEAVSADLFLNEGPEDARVGSVDVNGDGQSVTFQPTMSTEKDVLNGSVKLSTTDPLAIDDERFFSVGVTPLPKVLIVSESDASVLEMRVALEGDGGVTTAPQYELTIIRPSELKNAALVGQDIVCLVNVTSLRDAQWNAVNEFVRDGGGLLTVLGATEIESFTYNRAAAHEVLPAELDVWVSRPEVSPANMVFNARNGPFVDRLRQYESNGLLELLSSASIQRFWRVKPDESTRVIARYTADALPALLSRQVGKGLSVMLTTSLDVKDQRTRWSTIMLLENGAYWVGITFCDQLMRHLARVGSTRRNFIAGEIPTVPLSEPMRKERLLLQTPDLRNLPVEITDSEYLTFPDTTVPGHYVVSDGRGQPMAAFSINYPAEESDLTRADEADFASVFGEDQFEIARGLDELNEDIDVARFGQEAFPMLVLLVVVFFAGETLLSSRFYGDNQSGSTSQASRPPALDVNSGREVANTT